MADLKSMVTRAESKAKAAKASNPVEFRGGYCKLLYHYTDSTPQAAASLRVLL